MFTAVSWTHGSAWLCHGARVLQGLWRLLEEPQEPPTVSRSWSNVLILEMRILRSQTPQPIRDRSGP